MWAHGWGSGKRRGLRVWVLQLLARGPQNGAELMEQMDRMTMGWWRPSPGSIYPLLEQLESEKLVEKDSDGRYHLTESAQAGPDWMQELGFLGGGGPRTPEDAVLQLESFARYLEDLGKGKSKQLADLSSRILAVSRRLDKLADTTGARP